MTQAQANLLAAPTDTIAIRVIVRRVANQSLYRLRGKRRSYVLAYSPEMRCHFIDIPLAAWSLGIDCAKPYEDNQSVAHDIQANSGHAESLILLPVPWGGKVAAFGHQMENPFPYLETIASLRRLAVELHAPGIMIDAIDLVARGNPAKQTCLALDQTTDQIRRDAFLDSVPDEGPPNEPEQPTIPEQGTKCQILVDPSSEQDLEEPDKHSERIVEVKPKTSTPTLDRMKAMRDARAAKQAAKKAALQPA